MEGRAIYECPLCAAESPAVVTDLIGTGDAERLDARAKETLLHATCPRCAQRNPAGVAERARDRTRSRVIGTLAAAAFAGATWFLPWVAYVVLAIVVGITALTLTFAARERPRRWSVIASNVGSCAIVVAVVWLYPRGTAFVPLILAVRYVFYRGDEGPWRRAGETIRFERPYR